MTQETSPIAEVPAKKSNKGLIIGIVVALVLCCCCVAVIGVYFGYDKLMQYFQTFTQSTGY